MKFIAGAVLLLFSCVQGFSQRVCGTVVTPDVAITNTISVTNGVDGIMRDTVPNEVINIPIVVHVVFNTAGQNISDAQILSQIKVLNEDYRLRNATASNIPAAFKSFAADTRLNFCLAKVDPTGHETNGIIRKYTTSPYFTDESMKYSSQGGDNAWDCKKYLNIWVCYIFGRSLGFATLPGGPADKDGVVINYDVFGNVGSLRSEFNMGRTATHEIGHWLGLKHIWGDQDCGSDDVDDTPRQRFSNYYCPSFPHATTCSPNADGDMFMNYMDFTDDACMSMFTQGQKMKMRSLFAKNGSRSSFLNSFACDASLATAGPLPIDTTTTTIPTPVVKPQIPATIQVFPNPANDYININGLENVNLKGQTITLISTTGRVMLQQTLQSNTSKINVSRFTPGIYVLQIGQGADRKMFKIIKM
ncbi:MAG: M43 family zinc metalloprotease [Ferruginibacter sp.]